MAGRIAIVKPMPYDQFRTGLCYRDVFMMFWSYDADSRNWKYKRRRTVLGKWHQIKKEMYADYERQLHEQHARPKVRRARRAA